MAGIVWRDVNAPDFRTTLEAYRSSSEALDRGLAAARQGITGWRDNQTREASNALMANLMTRYTGDPARLQADAASGRLLAGFDPSMLSETAIASIGARMQDLQNFRIGAANTRLADANADNRVLGNKFDTVSRGWQVDDRRVFETDRDAVIGARGLVARVLAANTREERAAIMNDPANARIIASLPREEQERLYAGPLAIDATEANIDSTVAGTKGIEANTRSVEQATEITGERATAEREASAWVADLRARHANVDDLREEANRTLRQLPPLAQRAAQEQLNRDFPGLFGAVPESNVEGLPPLPAGGSSRPSTTTSRPSNPIADVVGQGMNVVRELERTSRPPSEGPRAVITDGVGRSVPRTPISFEAGSGGNFAEQLSRMTPEEQWAATADVDAAAQLFAEANPANVGLRRASGLVMDGEDPAAELIRASSGGTARRPRYPNSAPADRDYSRTPFSAVRDRLRNAEGPASLGGYNALAYNTGPDRNSAGVRPPRPLTRMSLGEVYAFQRGPMRARTRGFRGPEDVGSTGVGAYQFESQTLRETAERTFGANWRSVPFTPENQDRLAENLYNRVRGNPRALGSTWATFAGGGSRGTSASSRSGSGYSDTGSSEAPAGDPAQSLLDAFRMFNQTAGERALTAPIPESRAGREDSAREDDRRRDRDDPILPVEIPLPVTAGTASTNVAALIAAAEAIARARQV